MNNNNDRVLFDMRNEYAPLAQWLQRILANHANDLEAGLVSVADDEQQITDVDHITFYRQIPDFAQALLSNPTREDILRFGPLVFHLIGCSACHAAYLEIYDAMSATIGIEDESTTGQLPQGVAYTSTHALVYTCQLLVHKAAGILRENRHEHTVQQDAWARSLLQQAIYLSSHISQSVQRQKALQDLVDVATMFGNEEKSTPAKHTYAPVLSARNASRQRTMRRLTDAPGRPDGQTAIQLQTKLSRLAGTITQQNDVLELQLEDLEQELRGRFLLIDVPLGSLLEPVRWTGGNPRAIKSVVPVGKDGSLTTPLGRTELQLSNQEEYNLLEAMFILLDVRPTD